jgi:group I intron endonuclease
MTEPTEKSNPYTKARVYKLTNDQTDDEYVGSTCNPLYKRLGQHKADSTKERCKNRPLYQLMNKIGKQNFQMVLLEEYPCENREQLRARESYYIKLLKPTLNKIDAVTNNEKRAQYAKDYYKENSNKIVEYSRLYREKNGDRISARRNQPYLCECGSVITLCGKGHHAQTAKHKSYISNTQ